MLQAGKLLHLSGLLLLTSLASASVQPLHLYHMGEADSYDASRKTILGLHDSVGSTDLTLVGARFLPDKACPAAADRVGSTSSAALRRFQVLTADRRITMKTPASRRGLAFPGRRKTSGSAGGDLHVFDVLVRPSRDRPAGSARGNETGGTQQNDEVSDESGHFSQAACQPSPTAPIQLNQVIGDSSVLSPAGRMPSFRLAGGGEIG